MRELKIFFKEDKTITLEVPQDNIVEIVNMMESVYPDNLGYEIKQPSKKILKKQVLGVLVESYWLQMVMHTIQKEIKEKYHLQNKLKDTTKIG